MKRKFALILTAVLFGCCACQDDRQVNTYPICSCKLDHLDDIFHLYGYIYSSQADRSLIKVEDQGDVIVKKLYYDSGVTEDLLLRGRGPNEYTDLRILNIEPSGDFYASCVAKAKFLKFSPHGEILAEIPTPSRLLRATKLGSNIVAYGDFRSDSGDMYLLCDSLGRKLNSFGAYPDDDMPFGYEYKAMAYQGKMISNEKLSRFAFLTSFGNVLDIYEVRNDKATLIFSERDELPSYEPQSAVIGVRYKDFALCYVDAYATDRYIYALYSGKTPEKRSVQAAQEARETQEIRVYDWDGNHKCNLVTDIPILNLCVRADDRTIFAIYNDEGEMKICKFDLPEDML